MAKWSFSNCISITFWSGDLPSPLMAIFACYINTTFLEVLLNYLLHSVTVFFISILLNIIVSVVVVEDVQYFYLAHSLHIVTLV